MRVTLPLCAGSVTVSGGSTMQRASCVDALSGRSSPLGADMVGKSRNSFSDVLFTQGLMASIPLTIWCVRAQSVRNFVTEFSGGAAPQRCGVAQSWSSELATQAHSHPIHSRLMMAVQVGGRLTD